jgi:hypothetical protein
MTWQSLMTALDARLPCASEPLPGESQSAVFACRSDAGFGLPLFGSLFSESIFDPSAAEAETGSAEHFS